MILKMDKIKIELDLTKIKKFEKFNYKININMINLKKLDKEIDKLLKNETKESLLKWLKNKRKYQKNLWKNIG